jgi:hypothetical protein
LKCLKERTGWSRRIVVSEQYELPILTKEQIRKEIKDKKIIEAIKKKKKSEYNREYNKNSSPEYRRRKNKREEDRRKIIRNVKSYKDITRRWASLKRTRLILDTRKRKLNNISVQLTPEDIIRLIPKDLKCPIFKVPFVFGCNSRWNLSFDRINNNKSYTPDNVVVVSQYANRIKNVATSKELYLIADFYYELEKKQLDK